MWWVMMRVLAQSALTKVDFFRNISYNHPMLRPGLRPEEEAPSAQLSLYCVTGSAGILAGIFSENDYHCRQGCRRSQYFQTHN